MALSGLDMRKKMAGANVAIQTGNYRCDSCNNVSLLMCDICDSCNNVSLLMCDICDSGICIVETSNKLQLRPNNRKNGIRDTSNGFPVVVHYKKTNHLLKNLSCFILNGDLKTIAYRLICEQAFIHQMKTLKRFTPGSSHFFRIALLSPSYDF